MSIIDAAEEPKLRTLLMMLGQDRNTTKDHNILVVSYTKAIAAIPGLETAIKENWMSLPQYDKKTFPYHLPDDFPLPSWLVQVLIRKPELLPIMELFPYMKDSYCNESHTLKADFLRLPLQDYQNNEALESGLRYWHCTEEFLVDHLKRRDWLGLAGKFLHHLEDWRDPSFYRAMACFLLFQKDGGVLDPEVVYKLFETGFTHVKDNWHFYYPFIPRTLAFVVSLMRQPVWNTVNEMKSRTEWHFDSEWKHRLNGVKAFDAMMAWLHEIIIHKNYTTTSEQRALQLAKEDEKREARPLEDTEEVSSKRQKVEVEISQ